MKKPRPQKSTIPTSVSAKKSSPLNHQLFFTPYKLQWKNIQATATGQTSSRTFFNTMKNDLTNLKNDVQRMIKKQVVKSDTKSIKVGLVQDPSNQINQEGKFISNMTSKGDQKEALKLSNNFIPIIQTQNTPPEQNVNKADIHKMSKQIKQKQFNIQALTKQNKIQKNLITQLKKQNQQLYIQIQQLTKSQQNIKKKLNQVEQDKMQQIQSLMTKNEQHEEKIQELEDYNKKLIEKNCQILKKLQNFKNQDDYQIGQYKKANQQLRTHNAYLQQKIEGLSEKMSLVTGKFKEKDVYIRQLQTKLQAAKIAKKQHQIHQEQEKNGLILQLQQIIQDKQKQIQIRIEIQLKKSQRQFIQQIQQIQQRTRQAVESLEQQNAHFCNRIKELQQQLNKSKQQSLLLPINFITKETQTQEIYNQEKLLRVQVENINQKQIDYSRLGASFQKKINQLINENYNLKNKITNLQSDNNCLITCKQALQYQIKIFQEVKTEENISNASSKSQWEKLIFQVHNLKKEKDNIIQQFQFKILKLQNQLEQQRNKVIKCQHHTNQITSASGINFNKILKEQLQQNQDLKQKIRQQTRELQTLQVLMRENQQKQLLITEQLTIQRIKSELLDKKCKTQQQQSTNYCSQDVVDSLKYDLDLLTKKYQSLNSTLDSKNKQIKSKDQFIQKVLISKVGKKQDENQIGFILKELKIQKSKL